MAGKAALPPPDRGEAAGRSPIVSPRQSHCLPIGIKIGPRSYPVDARVLLRQESTSSDANTT